MRLSELEQQSSFALLGPGFGQGKWTLLRGLSRCPSGSLLVLPFEARGDQLERFAAVESSQPEVAFDIAPASLSPSLDERGHADAVNTVREAIAAGDVYQVNLSLRASFRCDRAASLFARLCRRGIPRFAAWVRLPDGREWVSASPELFVEVEGRTVRTEPMKGTAAPGQAEALRESEKDRAELAMITDLLRNDLAQVCVPKSVRVVNARRLIEVPYAVQAVSDIEGRLPEGVGLPDVLAMLHPGGSVTGAPKRAAVALIEALEATPRGFYCGALGYLGDALQVASLLIRTASRGSASAPWVYGVGGGIVWDSDAKLELEEVRLKLGAL